MQKRAAERKPLLHAAGEGRYPLAAGIPEPVPLEQHADPLAPLGDAVETAVEVEVLERASAPDRRVARGQVADATAIDGDLELTGVGTSRPAQSASSVDLPDPFGPVTSRTSRSSTSRSRSRSTLLRPEAPAEAARRDHTTTSASTNSEERDADDAVHREESHVETARVPRGDERVLVEEECRHHGDPSQ